MSTKKDDHQAEEPVLGTGASGDPKDPWVGAPTPAHMPIDETGDDVKDVNLPETKKDAK